MHCWGGVFLFFFKQLCRVKCITLQIEQSDKKQTEVAPCVGLILQQYPILFKHALGLNKYQLSNSSEPDAVDVKTIAATAIS